MGRIAENKRKLEREKEKNTRNNAHMKNGSV